MPRPQTRRRNSLAPTLYHVTTMEAAEDILQNGFLPGWGDVGYGVYFYGNPYEATAYAKKGGWDGALKGEHVVVLEMRDPRARKIESYELDPSWDSSLYGDMWVWEGDEDAEGDDYLVPAHVALWSDLGVLTKRGR